MWKQDSLPTDQQVADLNRNNNNKKGLENAMRFYLVNEFKVATPVCKLFSTKIERNGIILNSNPRVLKIQPFC